MRKLVRITLTVLMLLLALAICTFSSFVFVASVVRHELWQWQAWAFLAFGVYGLLKIKDSTKYLRRVLKESR